VFSFEVGADAESRGKLQVERHLRLLLLGAVLLNHYYKAE